VGGSLASIEIDQRSRHCDSLTRLMIELDVVSGFGRHSANPNRGSLRPRRSEPIITPRVDVWVAEATE
jgi:hypothetical protein